MKLKILLFLILWVLLEAKKYGYTQDSNPYQNDFSPNRRERVEDIFEWHHDKWEYQSSEPISSSDSSSSHTSSSSSSSESSEEFQPFPPTPRQTIMPSTPSTPKPPPCTTDYLTVYTTFQSPEYIDVQSDGNLTVKCGHSEAIFSCIKGLTFPNCQLKNEVENKYTCSAATGKYCKSATCNTFVTEVGCCVNLCPILTLVNSGDTSNLRTHMFYDGVPNACPIGRLYCYANNASLNSVAVTINGNPVINSGGTSFQELICDNDSKTWLYDNKPVTSAGCNVVPPISVGTGCNPNSLILTDTNGRIPQIQLFGDKITYRVNCFFQQPNPLGILQFNYGTLIPSKSLVSRATYLLVCQADGKTWGYIDVNGQTTTVTEISCVPASNN